MSILALDVGTKKIGLAYSEHGLLAEEFSTLKYDQPKQAIMQILFLIKQKDVVKIVIGLPKNSDGSDSKETSHVREFSSKLQNIIQSNNLKTKIIFEDEELTTKEAERILFNQGKRLEEVRERRDQLAAKLILNQYLDR